MPQVIKIIIPHFSFYFLPSYTHRLRVTHLMLIIRTFNRDLLLFYVIYSYIHLYINCPVMFVKVIVRRMWHFPRPMHEVCIRVWGPLMLEVITATPIILFYLDRASMHSGEFGPYHRCLSRSGSLFQLPRHMCRGFFYSLACDPRLISFH